MAANSKPRRWVIEVVDGFEPDEFEFIDDAFGGRIADDDDFAVAFEQFVDGLDDDGLGRIEGAQWFGINRRMGALREVHHRRRARDAVFSQYIGAFVGCGEPFVEQSHRRGDSHKEVFVAISRNSVVIAPTMFASGVGDMRLRDIEQRVYRFFVEPKLAFEFRHDISTFEFVFLFDVRQCAIEIEKNFHDITI